MKCGLTEWTIETEWIIEPWTPSGKSYVILHKKCEGPSTHDQKVYGRETCINRRRCHACGKKPPKHLLVAMLLMQMATGRTNE
jgi:hypothetical protein